MLAVLGTAGARAMAAPVGPIDVSGRGAAVAARLSWGLDGQGRVDRVTVRRDHAPPDQAVTVALADADGQALAVVTTVLRGTDAVVTLPAPVEAARITTAGVTPAA
jgi:hypothetical protein